MTTAISKVGATAAGAVVGAMAGGPIGLGIGVVAGGVVDYLRSKKQAPVPHLAVPITAPPTSQMLATAPAPSGLPAGADKGAASSAVHLMLLGQPAEVNPAKSWLTTFQKSVGLPATGALDSATRSMLILATAGGTYDAAKLPAKTILG